eukprot:TRINITY_DN9685_c0_g1_i3.p1 TRINITY_DN9685_c0_g1~~TRINITY_DN9685_c0_g1_i3.p1  ORF type:complete len:160 (+),score=19.38 TRINITY_DN9685_c0_g1_i3:89-568(+)
MEDEEEQVTEKNSVSNVEVYGFVGWLGSYIAYAIFLLWAFIPDPMLQAMGITYYPSKDWALIIPCWCCVFVFYGCLMYEAYNMMKVKDADHMENMQDDYSKSARKAGMSTYFHACEKGIPPLVDMPVQLVSSLLYTDIEIDTAEKYFGDLAQKEINGEK